MSRNSLDTSRIDHLISQAQTGHAVITVVGLGSGGAPVVQHLAMTGIRHWYLFDPDVLEPVNLVKHPAMRRDLGRPKVDIIREWLLDRLPDARVEAYQQDVIGSPDFLRAVMMSDLVINAVDNLGAREYINQVCVRMRVPFVSGSVYRTGFAGEVYAYVPGWSGCMYCMENYAQKQGLNIDDAVPLTPQEEEKIYGQNIRDFRLSGLAMDIATITNLHAQVAMSVLFGTPDGPIREMNFNWTIFANRPYNDIFKTHFVTKRMYLKPMATCECKLDLHQHGDTEQPHDVLGVSADASLEEIENMRAYWDERLSQERIANFGTRMQALYKWKRQNIDRAYQAMKQKVGS